MQFMRIASQLINTSYTYYMLGAVGLLGTIEYDKYRMNNLCNELTAKHNPGQPTYIKVDYILGCPYSKFNIFKFTPSTQSKEYITTETKLTVPPLLAYPHEIFILNNGPLIKKTKYNKI